MDSDGLLKSIERFLRDTGMSAAEFGHRAMGDYSFVYDLREGREARKATIQKALGWMRANGQEAA